MRVFYHPYSYPVHVVHIMSHLSQRMRLTFMNKIIFWLFEEQFDTKPTIQYIPRNMRTVFALLCFVVVIHWLISPYPSGLLHWHCGNLTIAPVPAKQPWWIWINTSCELIMNDWITTTKQSTTKPCAYFLGYTVHREYGNRSKTSLCKGCQDVMLIIGKYLVQLYIFV